MGKVQITTTLTSLLHRGSTINEEYTLLTHRNKPYNIKIYYYDENKEIKSILTDDKFHATYFDNEIIVNFDNNATVFMNRTSQAQMEHYDSLVLKLFDFACVDSKRIKTKKNITNQTLSSIFKEFEKYSINVQRVCCNIKTAEKIKQVVKGFIESDENLKKYFYIYGTFWGANLCTSDDIPENVVYFSGESDLVGFHLHEEAKAKRQEDKVIFNQKSSMAIINPNAIYKLEI